MNKQDAIGYPDEFVPLTIVTSIAPFELSKQQRATDSWLALGFRVVSLNVASERATLEAEFPNVEFHQPPRDGTAIAGKPLVYFDDILAWYRNRSEHTICGIINSDIVMAKVPCAMEVLRRSARDGMVISSRIDVASFDPPIGDWYPQGYDLFFFDRALIDCYIPSKFMLGMPWWDYWAPSAALLRGYPVRRLTSPLIYHAAHPVNYSKEAHQEFALEYIDRVSGASLAGLRQRLPSAAIRVEYSVNSYVLWKEAFAFVRDQSQELPVPAFDVAALEIQARWLTDNGHLTEAAKLMEIAVSIVADLNRDQAAA
ncbi:MAG: hypothetical protein ACI9BW_003636 [Gammaproteobacteria bacterium]|jgi:hypothetical protein